MKVSEFTATSLQNALKDLTLVYVKIHSDSCGLICAVELKYVPGTPVIREDTAETPKWHP